MSLAATWFAMMAAMMAPVAWPWIVALGHVHGAATAARRHAATASFIAGYAAAWLLYSCAAAAVQLLISATSGASVDPPLAAGVVLIGAGIVQFTPLKRACLRHCRNPLAYLLSAWHDAPPAPWRIGVAHGLYCVGCCWALMATMLVTGLMSLWWMAALTAATIAEQLLPRGELVRTLVGLALIMAGALQLRMLLA